MSAEEILAAMDKNKNYNTAVYNGSMEIHIGNETRSKQMKISGIGDQKALVEFTNPQDEGVKYLKIKKDLWIYFPSEQDMVKISGHLLKDGMMGSDVSYEDALESDAVLTKYTASIEKEEQFDNRDCWIVLLEAKVKDAPYFRRRLWIDKELLLSRKEEMYAKSGKLLKESRVLEISKIGSRNFPVKVEIVNKMRKDSRTIFTMTNITFDTKLPESLFSLQNLQR
jgi:outer membrane lipoprotein-sorting protein